MSESRGKKIFSTSMLKVFRNSILILLFLSFLDFLHSTYVDDYYLALNEKYNYSIWKFYYIYPERLITYLVLIFLPAVYYSLLRGDSFYENGILVNRGLPFFNRFIPYKNIIHYKSFGPKGAVIISTKDDQEFFITFNNIKRVYAILDQNGIKGDLSDQDFKKMISSQKKIFYLILFFCILMLFLQRFGFFHIFASSPIELLKGLN